MLYPYNSLQNCNNCAISELQDPDSISQECKAVRLLIKEEVDTLDAPYKKENFAVLVYYKAVSPVYNIDNGGSVFLWFLPSLYYMYKIDNIHCIAIK